MGNYDWKREQPTEGPAGWDWQIVTGTLLLSTGLIETGFIAGMLFQQWLLNALPA